MKHRTLNTCLGQLKYTHKLALMDPHPSGHAHKLDGLTPQVGLLQPWAWKYWPCRGGAEITHQKREYLSLEALWAGVYGASQ